jgi:hypothetical protein
MYCNTGIKISTRIYSEKKDAVQLAVTGMPKYICYIHYKQMLHKNKFVSVAQKSGSGHFVLVALFKSRR